MRKTFLKLSRLALLFVVFGFFMPVSCDLNSFDYTRILLHKESELLDFFTGLCFLALFLSATTSIIIMIVKLYIGESDKLKTAWILLSICIASCLIVFCRFFRHNIENLQYGAYVIVFALLFSLIFLICASISKDKKTLNNVSKSEVVKVEKENANIICGEIDENKVSLADRIRKYCLETKIEPARKNADHTIEISATCIHQEMNLENKINKVCKVLSGKKIRKLANVKIVREIGNNPSSDYSVVYEIL